MYKLEILVDEEGNEVSVAIDAKLEDENGEKFNKFANWKISKTFCSDSVVISKNGVIIATDGENVGSSVVKAAYDLIMKEISARITELKDEIAEKTTRNLNQRLYERST